MIGDWEILACANTLLRYHGEQAQAIVSERIADLTAQGDHAGARTFCRIQEQMLALGQHTPAAVH